MSIDASLNGEFRAATGMFASHAGQWVEVPLGGGTTPADPVWEEVPIPGPVTKVPDSTVPFTTQPIVTFDGELLTVNIPDGIGPPGAYSTYVEYFAIPHPVVDLTDDTVVYRVTAEIVSKTDPWPAQPVITLTSARDASSYAPLSAQYGYEAPTALNTYQPVGAIGTLVTSVQRNALNTSGTGPLEYERQMVRILGGPAPALLVRCTVMSSSANAPYTGVQAVYRLKMEKLVGAADGGTTPADPVWGARSSVPAITSPAWVFPDVPAIPPGANLRWSVANDPDDGLPSLRIQHDGFTAASQAIWTGTALVDAALDATLTQDALNCRAKVRLNIVTGFLTEYSVGRPESASALHNSGGLMVTGYANLSPLAAGVSTSDTYFGQTPVAPVPEGGYGWTRLILGGNISNNVLPPLDAYLRLEWEVLTVSDSGGGGGTPADPEWVEVAPIVGPVRDISTGAVIPGATCTLVDGVLTATLTEQPASGYTYRNWAVPIPVIDLTDDTVVYRITAELVDKSGVFWASSDMSLTADSTTDTLAGAADEDNTIFGYIANQAIGTYCTLGTSVQQQRLTAANSDTNNDYRRQLVRVMTGPNPAIVLRMGNYNSSTTAASISIRLKLEKLVGAPAGEPLPGTVEWSEDLLTGFNDAAAWTVAPFSTNAPLDAYTISNVGTDVLIDVPAWVEPVAYSSKGNTFQRALAVPDLTGVVAGGPVHLDLEFVYGAWVLPNTDPYVSLTNDEGDFINLTMPAATNTTGGSVKPNLSADALTSKLLAIFGGTNPRFTLAISGIAYSAGATLGPFNAVLKSLTLRKQIGMGPEVEVPTAAPHVWSTDEPAGADRARFWIGTSVKYGADRTSPPEAWPIGGTPVEQTTTYVRRPSTCTQVGGVVTLAFEGITINETCGAEWITTWQGAPVVGLIPAAEETLTAYLRLTGTLVGYSNDGGYTQGPTSISVSIDGGPWRTATGPNFGSDGTFPATFTISLDEAVKIRDGASIQFRIVSRVDFYFTATSTFAPYTVTLQDMAVDFLTISPSFPALKELVDDVYVTVDYPPV